VPFGRLGLYPHGSAASVLERRASLTDTSLLEIHLNADLVGAGTPYAQILESSMKSILKRIVMTLHSWELISDEAVIRAFKRFNLWSA
jgi:hypothetical protein